MGVHMRGLTRTRPHRFFPLLGAVVVALLLAWPVPAPAQAADPRLEEAAAQREAVQARLDEVLARLDAAQAETARVEDHVADLRQQAEKYEATAHQAQDLVEARIRDAYKRGQMPPAFLVLGGGASSDAHERARLLSIMAARHQTDSEEAASAQVRASAAARAISKAVAVLKQRQAELDAARADVAAALEEARAHELDVEQTIAAEEAARERAARARAARASSVTAAPAEEAAPAPDSGGSAASTAVSGGIACPIGTPRSYSDTYGAPRSGGRSHMGTDILSPHGTPIYAYESGTVTRLYGSSLGGISLYLQGDSGNLYYYTHLSGYASGMSAGQRVAAGEQVAYNGDTGNAAGIPHVHFEVMPGGGYNVNPYPYVLRACG